MTQLAISIYLVHNFFVNEIGDIFYFSDNQITMSLQSHFVSVVKIIDINQAVRIGLTCYLFGLSPGKQVRFPKLQLPLLCTVFFIRHGEKQCFSGIFNQYVQPKFTLQYISSHPGFLFLLTICKQWRTPTVFIYLSNKINKKITCYSIIETCRSCSIKFKINQVF